MGKTVLMEMSWAEAEEMLKGSDMAIFPSGAIHHHGVAPLGMDAIVANELGKRLGEMTGVMVLPSCVYGWCEYVKDYPGSIQVSEETLFNLYMDICRSANKMGIRRIVFLIGHGANMIFLRKVAYAIREEMGMLAALIKWYEVMFAMKLNVFGGDTFKQEYAVGVALGGEKVVSIEGAQYEQEKRIFGDKILPGEEGIFKFEGAQIEINVRKKDISESEKPMVATISEMKKKGDECVDAVLVWLAEFVKEFSKVPLLGK